MPGRLVDLGGHRVNLHPQPTGRLVHQVDRLVGQKAVRDVAIREGRRGDQRIVGDPHPVVALVPFLQSAENRDGVFDGRLLHDHGLKAALQRGVFLDVLAVLVEGCGPHAVQFAPGQGRLEQVRGVDRPLGSPGPDDGVQFVDEQDDPSLGFAHFAEHRLEAVFKLTAVLGSRDQGPHVEGDHDLVLQILRDIAQHNPVGQAFDNRGFPHARLADEDRVVLPAAGKNLDDPADFGVATDDRVNLPQAGHLDQVAAVLQQGLVLLFGVLVGHLLPPADRLKGRQHVGLLDAVELENPLGRIGRLHQGQQQVLGRDELILHRGGDRLGGVEHLPGDGGQ